MIARRDAAGVLAAMLMALGALSAQTLDSVPPVRHVLAIDFTRVRPFHRSYDMVVISGDSTVSIGRRDVGFFEVATADSPSGWMLVESRTGVVSATDSIFFAPDLRPMRWRSVVGGASLDMAFSSDSTAGVITLGHATTHLAISIPPDLILSSAGVEMLAALLPLASAWADSANALSVDLTGARVEPSELAVTGEDSVVVRPGAPPRSCWLLTLRSGTRESRHWVDRETGEVVLAQTRLPSHVGSVLEYRMRPVPLTTAP